MAAAGALMPVRHTTIGSMVVGVVDRDVVVLALITTFPVGIILILLAYNRTFAQRIVLHLSVERAFVLALIFSPPSATRTDIVTTWWCHFARNITEKLYRESVTG
jgi:energy-converting hydrogenase Eha subunit E